MMNFQNITGKREVKTHTEEVVIVKTTKGTFNLSPLAAKKLEVEDKDAILIVLDGDKNVYLGKGRTGTPILDEKGNHVKDKRGRLQYEENSSVGATVRPASEGSLLLSFSGVMAWGELGGNEETNRVFTLGEGVQGTSDGVESTFYPLEFLREEEKLKREKGEDKAEGVAETPEEVDPAFADEQEV